jgi:hypothetical protein
VKILCAIVLAAACVGCGSDKIRMTTPVPGRPAVMLWAWERPENLNFIDTKTTGIALLAQTLYLEKDGVEVRPRMQPLYEPPGVYMIAVTRIETNKKTDLRSDLSDEQIERISAAVKRTLELPNIKEVQIDFDAALSERAFYRKMMKHLRSELPPEIPLSMTALASWCVGDVWLGDMPVVEAVPMVFEMGADNNAIRSFLKKGNDWNEPLCRASYGISVNEQLPAGMHPDRGAFYFNAKPWRRSDKQFLP